MMSQNAKSFNETSWLIKTQNTFDAYSLRAFLVNDKITDLSLFDSNEIQKSHAKVLLGPLPEGYVNALKMCKPHKMKVVD